MTDRTGRGEGEARTNEYAEAAAERGFGEAVGVPGTIGGVPTGTGAHLGPLVTGVPEADADGLNEDQYGLRIGDDQDASAGAVGAAVGNQTHVVGDES